MRIRIWPGLTVLALALVELVPSLRADDTPNRVPADHAQKMQQGLDLFKVKVRPVLIRHCLDCHGGKAKKGGLDLSDRKPLVDSGVLEGGSKESRLTALIRHEEDPHMPQKAAKLPDATIAAIARWIDLGAPYDRPLVVRAPAARVATGPIQADKNFWSFRPLTVVPPPLVQRPTWIRTPVDRFILAALERRDLKPNPIADRRTLIRRVTFDLTGLPPSPAEIDSFVRDPAPDAYERLVDRLLTSPDHGERFACHWMDVARFAESHGYEQDYDRPFAYHYRDFLIRAFNGDMPYDQLVHWQLAGDELAPDDPLAMAATGFLGAGAFPTQLTEAEFESARYNELDDMVATTGVAFLGLSVGCAVPRSQVRPDPVRRLLPDGCRLHDHDPERDRGLSGWGRQAGEDAGHGRGLPAYQAQRRRPRLPPLLSQDVRPAPRRRRPEGERGGAGSAPGSRGWWQRYRSLEGRTLGRARPQTSYRRSALAAWLTDTEYGAGALAARVMVNRLWQHHFGQGIVATPNDFGAQGSRPSHPELLDWLADALIANGWRLKPIHRLIVTSAVYMQDSRYDESRAAVDRENVFQWRRTPRRLEAEPIRDAMLAVAGRLDRRMYGPGSLDVEMPRRSVFFFIKRSRLIPMMMLFDWPEHLVSIGQRSTTTTAPQALAMLNSGLARHCAESFAARLAARGDPASSVARAYRIAFGRDPTESEARLAAGFMAAQRAAYARDGRPDPDRSALVDLCQALIGMNEFIYIP